MAAGDLALSIAITATSDAGPIIEQVSAAVDALQATLDAVGSGAGGLDALDAAFATLDSELTTLQGSLGAFPVGIEAATAAFDAFDTALTTIYSELGLIPGEGDITAQSLANAGISATQAQVAIDALDTALAALYQGLGLIPPGADVGAQALSNLGTIAQQTGAYLSEDGIYMDAFAQTFNGVEAAIAPLPGTMSELGTVAGETTLAFSDLATAMNFIDGEATVAEQAFGQLLASSGELAIGFGDVGTAMAFVDTEFATAMASMDTMTSALDTEAVALQVAGQAAGDYAVMTANMTGGMDAAMAGMTGLDDAVAMESVALTDASAAATAFGGVLSSLGFSADTVDAAMSAMDGIISTVGGAFGMLGAEAGTAAVGLQEEGTAADGAAAATRTAGEAGATAGFELMMLAGMLLMAGQGFVSMGTSAQDDIAKIAGLADQSMAGAAGLDKLNATVGQLEQVSLSLGVTLDSAAQGMYFIISAGFNAADSLKIMTVAMEAAKGLSTDFTGVANGLTSILRAYNLTGADAARVTDMYVEAIKQGKQTPQDFARAIGNMAASAHSAGLSLQEMFAAEATLSQMNPRIRQDTQNLAHVFDEMATKSDALAAKARDLGGGLSDVQFAALPLIDRLKYLGQVAGGDTIAAFEKMGLDATGARIAFELLSDGGKHYTDILNNEVHSQNALDVAFKESETTISAGAAHMTAALSVLAYQFVTLVSPMLAPLLHAIGSAFQSLATHGETAKVVMLALAGALGGVLIVAIEGVVIWLAGAIGWIGLIAAAIGALIGVFIYLYTTSSQVRAVVDSLVGAVKTAFGALVAWVQGSLLPLLKQLGAEFVVMGQYIMTSVVPAVQQFLSLLPSMGSAISLVGQLILGLVGGLVSLIGFFTQTDVGTALLIGAFSALAYVLTGTIVEGLIAITVAMWGWVAAATAAAVDNIIAFWPVYLAVAAIVLIVAAVVLAVRHWGEIVGWLAGVWQAFASWFMGLFGPEVNAVVSLFQNMVAVIGGAFNGLMAILSQVASFISGTFVAAWNGLRAASAFLLPIFQQIGSVIGGVLAPVFAQFAGVLTGSLLPAWQGILSAGGAIIQIFTSVGQSIASIVVPAFRALLPILGPIVSYIGGQLMPLLKGFGIILLAVAAIIGGVVVAAIAILISVLVGLLDALAHVILGVVQFVSGLIQLFTGVVQVIIGIFQGFFTILIDICTGNWSKIGSDAAAAWHTISAGLLNIIGGLWMMIQGLFNISIGAIIGFFQGFVTTLIGIATALYNALVGHSIFPDMMNAILQLFMNLASQGPQIMQQMAAGVVNAFLNMAAQSVQPVISLANNVITWFENMYNTVVGHSIMSNMQAGVTSSFQQMSSSGISTSAGMSSGVDGNFTTMSNNALGTMQTMSATALKTWQNMNAGVTGQMQQLDQNTIAYFNDAANYVDAKTREESDKATEHIINMHRNLIKNFEDINTGTQATVGDMSKVIPQDFANLSQGVQGSMSTLQGNINNIFLGMQTTAVSDVNDMVRTITDTFTSLQLNGSLAVATMSTDVTQKFNTMQMQVSVLVSAMVAGVTQQFNTMQMQVSIYTSIMATGVEQQMQTMSSKSIASVSGMASQVTGLFSSMAGAIAGIMSAIQGNVNGVFSQIASSAGGYGSSMMANFIAGANSQMGNLAATMQHAASIVASYMPHSPAKVGPLSHLDEFMPGMIRTLTAGIEAGGPSLDAAMRHLVQPIAAPLAATGSSFAGGRYPTGGGGTTIINQITVQSPDIYLDGTNVTQKIGKRFANEIRRQGAVRSR